MVIRHGQGRRSVSLVVRAYSINGKTTGDTYNAIVTAAGTHPRLWNSTTSAITTNGVSSLYSMNHRGVAGDLYIFGDFVNNGYTDYWSYANDFDGAVLGTARAAKYTLKLVDQPCTKWFTGCYWRKFCFHINCCAISGNIQSYYRRKCGSYYESLPSA
jgi:hypothetical protein